MIILSRVFHENQKAFLDKKRYIVNQGGSSSTKTFSILQLLTDISRKKKWKIDVVSMSVPHLKSGVLTDMPMVCEGFNINFHDNFNISDKIFKGIKGNINFMSIDKLGKAHGGRRDILYINEGNHIPWAIVEQLIIRTRLTVIIDYNPTNEFWVHKHILPKYPNDSILIKSTYKDNPRLEKSIIDYLESKKGDNNFWRVYGLGELGKAEGLIYNNFELNAQFDKERFKEYRHGLDWGFSVDPFSYIRIAVDFAREIIYVCDEIYGIEMQNTTTAPLVQNIAKNQIVFCDCAEPKSIEEYKTLGVNAKGVKKGQGSVETGIKYIQRFKIIVHEDCPHFAAEISNYSWKVNKVTGEQLTTPEGVMDHLCLIGNTLITTKKGEKKIKHIKKGDYVFTRYGYKKVLAVELTKKNTKVNKYCFSKGNYIIGTPDHLIFTDKGIKSLQNLNGYDKIYYISIYQGFYKWINKLYLITKCIIGTVNIIRLVGDVLITAKDFMQQFGNFIMEVLKKVMKYTTKTMILLITILKILSMFLKVNIDHIMLRKEKKSFKSICQKLWRQQRNGIKAKKGGNGTQNMLKSNGKIKKKLNTSVHIAIRNLSQKKVILKKQIDFAVINVKQLLENLIKLIIFQPFVYFVVKLLNIISIKKEFIVLERVLIDQEQDVYNLLIEDKNEFFANGILVHNCDALRYALEDDMTGLKEFFVHTGRQLSSVKVNNSLFD